jgi:outer membrane protein
MRHCQNKALSGPCVALAEPGCGVMGNQGRSLSGIVRMAHDRSQQVRSFVSCSRKISVTGRLSLALGGFAALALVAAAPATAQDMGGALARAYEANPTLNAQRALLRATNELVPQALSGYRPKINATADAGRQYSDNKNIIGAGRTSSESNFFTSPRGAGLSVEQTLFNSGKTASTVSQAESRILGQREALRNAEQNVLLDAATAYMNVLRDTAILNLNTNNVEVLEEQLRQTRDRFQVGEVTRTDVAQAQAALAGSQSQAILSQSNLKTSIARYRQQVGSEPKKLAPGKPVEQLMPKKLPDAVNRALADHPAIIAALHGVDAAELNVKVVESDLYPTIGVTGTLAKRYDFSSSGDERFSASVVGRLTVPIYEGGAVYSRTREAKETAGQRRIEVDTQRDLVRATVISAWGAHEASKAQIEAAQAQVSAAETALNGVREEAKVGQRTTIDVLNAQQVLLTARSTLVTAQRDRVVASYAVLSAVGRLSARTLSLKVAEHDPRRHYQQVRDKLWGLQTPEGR